MNTGKGRPLPQRASGAGLKHTTNEAYRGPVPRALNAPWDKAWPLTQPSTGVMDFTRTGTVCRVVCLASSGRSIPFHWRSAT
jgi:hypothetical protein